MDNQIPTPNPAPTPENTPSQNPAVEAPSSQANTASQLPPSPHKSFLSSKIVLLIVILLILLGTGGVYLALKAKNTQYRSVSKPVVKIIPSTAPTQTPNPTAGWKTYANEVFSLKYPPSWEVISSDSKDIALTGKENVTKIFVAHQYSSNFSGSFENWCAQDLVCKGSTLTKKTLNGITVYQLTSTDEQGANTPGTWTYIQHGVYVYQIYWGVSALDPTNNKFSDLVAAFNNDTIFNQILSTFKFLK